MSKESLTTQKIELRKRLLVLRSAIPKHRRDEAAAAIRDQVQSAGPVCSFFSIGSEVDLSLLNELLAKEGRLISTRLEEGKLVPYWVESEKHLVVSHLNVPEPNPVHCKKAYLSEIGLILVPGLGFDKEGYRIGYGKGHYDRFLANAREIPTAGIGFREQLTPAILPRDPWDLPVQELILV